MKINVGGVEILNQVEQVFNPAPLIDAFEKLPGTAILANAQLQPVQTIPELNVDKMSHTLIEVGQEILLGTAGVVVVVCGILIAVGLKREGWKRVLSILQGLGVGIVGPTVVIIVAAFFSGFARIIS